MLKKITFKLLSAIMLTVCLFLTADNADAQTTILSEDFESVTAPALPAGWTSTNPNGGDLFITGDSAAANAGTYWPIVPHGQFALANDDLCNCDMSEVRLILPPLDLTGFTSTTISAEVWSDQIYTYEENSLEVSLDNGATWTTVGSNFPVMTAWQVINYDLSAYDGMSNVWVAFRHNDIGGWGQGLAVDDVLVEGMSAGPTCFFTEDFEGVTAPALPAGWITENPNGGDLFITGDSATANSGGYWALPSHGQFALANDDLCNCDMSEVRLILPPQDFSGWTGVTINAEVWSAQVYTYEENSIEVSLDNGATWVTVGPTFPVSDVDWQVISYDLSAYDGLSNVWVAFRHNDVGGWGQGLAVDDVCIEGTPVMGPDCFFSEDFEGVVAPALPAGFTSTNPNGGDLFITGDSTTANAGGYWALDANTQFALANDDLCNCDMSEVRLILPPQDFTTYTNIELTAEVWSDQIYTYEENSLEVSIDNGVTWTQVGPLFPVMTAWQIITVDLSAYAGMSNVLIAFRHNDVGGWGQGLAVDDISICNLPGGPASNAIISSASRLNAEYTVVPITQEPPALISAEVLNGAGSDLTNLILTSRLFEESDPVNPVAVLTSTPVTLTPGASMVIDNNPTALTIGGVGRWYVEHIVSHDNSANESDTSNDTLVTPIFEISETLYARNDTTSANLGGFGIGTGGGNNAIIGQNFEMINDGSVEAVEVVVAGDPMGVVGEPISVAIYACDANGIPQAPAIDTTEVQLGTMPLDDELFTLNFDTPVDLAAGTYFFGALEEGTGNVGIVANADIYTPGDNTMGTNWVTWDGNPNGAGVFTEPTTLVAAFAVAYHIRPILAPPACEPGDLVGGGTTVGVCGPGETFTLDVSATAEVPPGGGYGWNFSPGADGTGGVITGFSLTNVNTSVTYDAGLNGILAANGLADLGGTWTVTGFAFTDPNNVGGTLCGFTPTSLTVIFTAGDLATAPTSTAEDCGLANGSADAGATGGYMGLSYEWSNGSTDNPATGLTAGTYTVTVTDDAGCTSEASVTVASADGPNPSVDSVIDVDCFGNSNGQINVTVSGGSMPYTFAWSNGSTLEDPDGLPGGMYSGTITDATGCSFVVSGLVVNEPPPLAPDFATLIIQNVSCNGAADGLVSVDIIGGTPPYTYNWSNGATTAGLTGLSGGSYTGTVTDANGCLFVTPIPLTISEPGPITAPGDLIPESSAGAGDGSIDITPAGGTGAYTFEWSNGATTEDISGLGAGPYALTITDENGCTEEFMYDLLVGIEDVEELQSLTVYPNPSSDRVNIKIELDQAMEIKLDVFSVTGQLVMSFPVENVSDKEYQLSMQDQPAGIYMARLFIGDQVVTERFTIAR